MKKIIDENQRLYEMETEERLIRSELGIKHIAGVDEAGRGPLAGPVYAAAVILPEGCKISGLNDSKKLTEKKREELYDIIINSAISWSVQAVDEKIIDDINILNATFLAMNNAVDALEHKPEYVFIDGNRIKNMKYPYKTIVKGDAKSINIAAASILAKVSRDRYICDIAAKYPEYSFESHKGYGTKAHIDAILKHGPCAIHRRSFLKKILGEEK